MIQMIHIHILFSFAYVSIVCCTNSISLVTIDQTKLRNWEGYVRASGNALLDQRKVYSADTILPHEQPPQSDVCAGGHSVLATIRTRLNPKHSYTELHAATWLWPQLGSDCWCDERRWHEDTAAALPPLVQVHIIPYFVAAKQLTMSPISTYSLHQSYVPSSPYSDPRRRPGCYISADSFNTWIRILPFVLFLCLVKHIILRIQNSRKMRNVCFKNRSN